MAAGESVSTAKRARTGAQKERRRRAILEAARAHLGEAGFEAFSMAEVGRRAGVAKGTLYLYFETREEILLALHCESLDAWGALLEASVHDGMNDEEFASVFYETMYADEIRLPLMSRLDSVIEHNVSLDVLIASKRSMAALITRSAGTCAAKLGLSFDQTVDALGSLGALLLGVAQVDSGPNFITQELPADARQFIESFSSRDIFTRNACRILAGIRAGL